jgi:hypothetical protein
MANLRLTTSLNIAHRPKTFSANIAHRFKTFSATSLIA